MIAMPFTALVTVAAVILTFALSMRVGKMRQKHGVKAPATTGHPEFERANRVHQNTMSSSCSFCRCSGSPSTFWATPLPVLSVRSGSWDESSMPGLTPGTLRHANRYGHHHRIDRCVAAGVVMGDCAGVHRLGRCGAARDGAIAADS